MLRPLIIIAFLTSALSSSNEQGYTQTSFENAVFDGIFNDIKVVEKNVMGTVFRGEFRNAQFNNTVLSQRTKSDVNIQYIPKGSNGVNERGLTPYNIFEKDITYYDDYGSSYTMQKHEWWYSPSSIQRYDSCDIGQDSKRITSDILNNIANDFPDFYSADRCAYACGNDSRFWKYSIMWWDLEDYCYCVNDMDVCIHGRCNFPCSGTPYNSGGYMPVELVYEIPHTEISSSKFEGDFSGADFTLVDIETSHLNGTFENSTFYKTSITDTVLTGHFNDANMNFIFMDNVTLDGDFQNINFQNAILKNTHLGGNFSGADFDNAALEGSDISKITHMFKNRFFVKCPTGVPQGFICNNGRIVGPDYNTDIRLDWLDTTTFSDIDFAGHEIYFHRFNQRILPSETLSCDGASFVEDEIVTASNYVSVPLITNYYLDICTDTNKIVLSATSAEDCWSKCQLNAASAHDSSNFSVHWPTTLYKNGECQCIGTLVGVFDKTVDTSPQTCTPLNQCNACQVGCSSDEDCAGSLKCGSGGDAWHETNGPWGCGQALEDSGLNFCYYDMQMCSDTYREYDTDGMTLMTAESIAFQDRPIERDPIINLFDHNSGSLTKYTDIYCKDGIKWTSSGSLEADKQYVDYDYNGCGGYCTRNKNDDIDACKSFCLGQKKLGFLMEFETTRTRCTCTDKYVAPSFEYTSYQCQDVATHIDDTSHTMAQLNYEYYEFGEDYHSRIPKFTGISSDATFKQIGVYNGASVEHKEAEGCSTYPCDSYEASTAEWCDMEGSYSSTQQTQSISDSVTNTCIQDCKANNAVSVVVEFKNIFHGFLPNAPFKQIGKFNQGTDSIETLEASNCQTYPCSNYVSISGTPTWCNNNVDATFTSPTQTDADTNTCLETCKSQNARSVVIDYSVIDNGISNVKFKRFGDIQTSNSKPYFSGRTKEFYKYYQQPYKDEDSPSYPYGVQVLQDLGYDNYPNFFTAPSGAKIKKYCDVVSPSTTWSNTGSASQGKSLNSADSALLKESGTNYHLYTWEASYSLLSDSRWRCMNICVRNHDSKSVIFNVGVQGPDWRNRYYYWHECVCQDVDYNNCPEGKEKFDFQLTHPNLQNPTKYGEYIEIDDDLRDIESLHCYCQTDTIETCPENKISNSLIGKREYFEFLESGYNQTFETNCNCQDSYVDACPSHQLKTTFEDNKIYVEFDQSSYEWNRYTETYPNLFVDKVPTFPTKREIEPTLQQGYEVCKYDESDSTWRLVEENKICGDFSDSIELGTVCTSLASCTPENCANACAARSDCHFFIFGNQNSHDDWRGLCKMQTTSHVSCPEGFITGPTDSDDEAKFSFYEMYPAGETVSLYKPSEKTCEQTCYADTRQLYWSSYKEIPGVWNNAGMFTASRCVCSIHNSSVCTREFTPLSTDQYYYPNAMQYDAQTFESADMPSCEDGRYLFGARIDWRQTLKTDGWLWSMNVSGAGITFHNVQKTRRCPRDMEPGSSKAVDGVICIHGDVTSFEETTERTIPLDQTANDFCASGDRVRVFDGRGDNPGISADERFNYCAEACSKRLQPVDGTWTSNAVAFVYYEGLAGDALNGRCWCELSSGCADELEIDGLADLHFVSFGTGDTLLTTSSGSGLSVYYFLGPNDRYLKPDDPKFAAGPPSVAMNGIRSSWVFPLRYEPQGEYHFYEFCTMNHCYTECRGREDCNVCQGHCKSDWDCAGDLVCYSRGDSHVPGCIGTPAPNTNYCYDPNTPTRIYNASLYNFTGMISDKIEKCPSGLPANYVCTNIDVGHADIDKSAGYVIWGRHIDLQVVPYFLDINFELLQGFSIDWFGGVSYRFQDCIFQDMYGLAPLYLSPLENVTGIDFSKWWDIDSAPTMENTNGRVLSCPPGPLTVHPDFATIRSPSGNNVRVHGSQVSLTSPVTSSYNIKAIFGLLTLPETNTDVEGCLDYVYYENTAISSCNQRQSLVVGQVETMRECLSACWNETSAVFNTTSKHCVCESARYPSDDCVPYYKYENLIEIVGDEICKGGEKKYMGYVYTEQECWHLCQEEPKNWPALILEDATSHRGVSNPNQKCFCISERMKDDCEVSTRRWWETQYEATLDTFLFNDLVKYNVNYCREPWSGYGLGNDNQQTPYILQEDSVKFCPDCEPTMVPLDCSFRDSCLSCPIINHKRLCLVPNWPFQVDIQFEMNIVKTMNRCVDKMFIGPKINIEGMSLVEIDFMLDILTVSTVVTGQGLAACPPLQYIPDGWVCYNKHFYLFSDLINAKDFDTYSQTRANQITSENTCCEGLNMTGLYLKHVPVQMNRSFVGAIWNGVHGDAFSFLTSRLSPEYEVKFIGGNHDPEGKYILVGPYVSLRNRKLKGVNFANMNLTGVDLDGTSMSWVGDICPSQLPDEWHCLIYDDVIFNVKQIKVVGPTSDLQFTNLEGFNFTGVSLENANLRNSYGKLAGCPAKLPADWGCNPKDKYLLGPGADLSGADITNITTVPPWSGMLARCPDTIESYTCIGGVIIGYSKDKIDFRNTNVTGFDLSQIRLTNENALLKFVSGQLKACPLELPTHYKCINRRIVGPYANLKNINMTGANLKDVKLYGAILNGAFGQLSHCPTKAMGYTCIDNYIVGLGYVFADNIDMSYQDMSNVDFSQDIMLHEKNVNFYGVFGKVLNCYLHGKNAGIKWLCVQNRIIGPGVNVTGIDLFEESAIYDHVDFTDIHGFLNRCPKENPKVLPRNGYKCLNRVFIAPGVDIRNLDSHFANVQIGEVNLTRVRASGTNFGTTILMNTYGRMEECPNELLPSLQCQHGYIIGPSQKAWFNDKPEVPIDLQETTIYGLSLWDNIALEKSVWHKVRVFEPITVNDVSGTMVASDDPILKCSYLGSNVQCFKLGKDENTLQIITAGGTIPNGTFHGIEPLKGQMHSITCDLGTTLEKIRLDGISLQDSDFSNCEMKDVMGTFTGNNVIWPDICDVLSGNMVLCGQNLNINYDFDVLQPQDVYSLNRHIVQMTGQIKYMDVENINMTQINLKNAQLQEVVNRPNMCPMQLPRGWLCLRGTIFIGPGQDLRGQNYSTFARSHTIIIENATMDEYTVLPPNVQIIETTTVQTNAALLNPNRNYQVQNRKLIGPGLKVSGPVNIDFFEGKSAIFLHGINLAEATFTTTSHVFRINTIPISIPAGYRILPAYESGSWLKYVIGPSLTMPAIWDNQNGICRQNISLAQADCQDWLDGDFFQTNVENVRGPLHTCYASGQYHCHGNWLIGPNIDWYGFTDNIDFETSWFTKTVHNIGVCPGDEYLCVATDNMMYTAIGPNMTIENEVIDLADGTYTDISFAFSRFINSVIQNGHVHLSSIERLTLVNTTFINVTMSVDSCPVEREFNNSFKCNGDGLYCHEQEVFLEGQVISSDTDISRACLKNMIIPATNSLQLNTTSLENTELPDNSSNLQINILVKGRMRKCPSVVPYGVVCHDNEWINGYQTFYNKDVSGIDFSGVKFAQGLPWYNVYGIAQKCPDSVPRQWKCIDYVNKRTYKDEAMFIGSGIDFSRYDHFPDDVDITDVSLKDATFDPLKRFFGLKGFTSDCPKQLPKGYNCFFLDPFSSGCSQIPPFATDEDEFVIIGPYTNVEGMNLKSICLTEETKLIGIEGQTIECPQLSNDLIRRGFYCGEDSENFIIGPGVSLNGFNLQLLDDLAADFPNVNLNFATILDKLLIRQNEESSCETIENIISDTCRGKYTDECSNNIPNYICKTSNLHLGTCGGVCGDNITSKYSETLSPTYRLIKTNSVPNRAYHIDRQANNGNDVCEHYLAIQMIQHPEKSHEFKETCLGPIGILKSGELIYNHLENLQESFQEHSHTLDTCQGHADSNCFYHVHNLTAEIQCLHYQPCEHIGYIRDGFPLYSHCSGLKSCYKNQQYEPDDECHLDEANGFDFTGKGIYDVTGSEIEGYAYVVSHDFPHMPIKYAGTQIFDFVNINNF